MTKSTLIPIWYHPPLFEIKFIYLYDMDWIGVSRKWQMETIICIVYCLDHPDIKIQVAKSSQMVKTIEIIYEVKLHLYNFSYLLDKLMKQLSQNK